METILQRIVERIEKDERENFANFDPENFELKRSKPVLPVPELIRNNFFVIAEVKKGSPSKGIIREDFDPLSLAREYERAGAGAVSVITEKNFFFGNKMYLSAIKEKVNIPVLRKDFIIHEFQIYEAYNLGADIILLITAALSEERLAELYKTASRLGIHTLAEVHNREELEIVLKTGCTILGINNRDLKTFSVDINKAFKLKKNIPDTIPVICESGIKSYEEIKRLKDEGFSGALIGESLLKRNNVFKAFRELIYGEG